MDITIYRKNKCTFYRLYYQKLLLWVDRLHLQTVDPLPVVSRCLWSKKMLYCGYAVSEILPTVLKISVGNRCIGHVGVNVITGNVYFFHASRDTVVAWI